MNIYNIRPRFRRRGLLYKSSDNGGIMVLFQRSTPVCVIDNGEKSGYVSASIFHDSPEPALDIISAIKGRHQSIIGWLKQRSCRKLNTKLFG